MNDAPNPDWVAWLARAECEASGEDIDAAPVPYVMVPNRPDRGWQRLGDVAAKIVAAVVVGGGAALAVCAVIFGLRAL